MISDAFGVGVTAPVLSEGTFHAAHTAAAPAAAKHAAAASVDRGHT